MRFHVRVTDSNWFRFLAAQKPDEVNFWIPSGQGFQAVREAGLLLFKLKRPYNAIAGGGFFLRFTRLPVTLAWDAFGMKNGTATLAGFVKALQASRPGIHPADQIGCCILTSPFFLAREQWIPTPEDFSSNIVTGKTYDTTSASAQKLLSAVRERLSELGEIDELLDEAAGPERPLRLIRARVGQGGFRALVTDAYTRRCAISGERTLPALEAAHIKPYVEAGPNRTENGLLLRSDLHKLFDAGYLTVTPARCIEVSRRIREEFENGKDYYRYHGQPLRVLPGDITEQPDAEFLNWHNDHVFRP